MHDYIFYTFDIYIYYIYYIFHILYIYILFDSISSDAVMLSGESAAGKYPVESVTMQQLVINKVETDVGFRASLDRFAEQVHRQQEHQQHTIASAITVAARQVQTVELYDFLYL